MPIPLAATPNPNQAKPPRKRLRLLSAQACPEPAADHVEYSRRHGAAEAREGRRRRRSPPSSRPGGRDLAAGIPRRAASQVAGSEPSTSSRGGGSWARGLVGGSPPVRRPGVVGICAVSASGRKRTTLRGACFYFRLRGA
jgi:hypothetical protein